MKLVRCVHGKVSCDALNGLLLVFLQIGFVQAQNVSPTRVINLQDVIPGVGATWRIADVTQSNGHWAVLLRPVQRHSGSAIVTGDSQEQRVSLQIGAFDRIIMDREHLIYLRHASTRLQTTEFSRWKADSDGFETRTVAEAFAEPVVSEGLVQWKTDRVRVDAQGNRRSPAGPTSEKSELSIPERRIVLGLPERRYMVFGSRTEEIMIFDEAGTVVGTARADLDSAYASLGLRVSKPDVQSGKSRVVWAASSRDGLLFVHLSETPITRPTPIAVFNPTDGRLIRVISAVHPTAEGGPAADDQNPVGLAYLGAIDDQLIVVYSKGYVAFY